MHLSDCLENRFPISTPSDRNLPKERNANVAAKEGVEEIHGDPSMEGPAQETKALGFIISQAATEF